MSSPLLSPDMNPAPLIPGSGTQDLGHRTSMAKRARKNDDDGGTPSLRKKKKQKRAHLKADEEDEMLDSRLNLNTAIGKMNSYLLADYVAQSTKRFAADLSLVEFEDKRIPALAFSDTSDWNSIRNLDNISSFLTHCHATFGNKKKALVSASESPGSPHTLIITSAGLRAADLTRALRTFQRKDAAVAKLFAKHIKLREAIDMVRKTRMSFGVGTPLRIIDLLDSGALSSSALDRVVIDCSHIDQKRRGILDMSETQEPLIRLLNRPELKNRYGMGEADIQLLFY